MRTLVLFFALLGCIGVYSQAQEPERDRPVARALWEMIFPEEYNVKITLSSGEVVEITKVSMSKRGLEARLTTRVLDKTIHIVLDDGSIKTIKSHEIEKIEISKTKDTPKPDNTAGL